MPYDWSSLSSVNLSNCSMDVLDHLFDPAQSSPLLEAAPSRRPTGSNMSDAAHHDSLPPCRLRSKSSSSTNSSDGYASSENPDDSWLQELLETDAPVLPSVASNDTPQPEDRHGRRREQNRKAQSNFRQKRKAEVRRLEQELQDLRAQIATYHKQGPTVGLTICTRCRNFYPPSVEATDPLSTESQFFDATQHAFNS